MDCHEKGSNFKLLGYFKELDYTEWMEQTFKHMGICIWDDDTTKVMYSDRTVWPQYCTASETVDETTGNILYFDMMPLPEGRITIGLYTDQLCNTVYSGKYTAEEVLYWAEHGQGTGGFENNDDDNNDDNDDGQSNYYNNGGGRGRMLDVDYEEGDYYSLEHGISEWNEGFDYFKVCQPCMTYTPPYKWGANASTKDSNTYDDNNCDFDMGKFQCQAVNQVSLESFLCSCPQSHPSLQASQTLSLFFFYSA
jgi:hypothetical protein